MSILLELLCQLLCESVSPVTVVSISSPALPSKSQEEVISNGVSPSPAAVTVAPVTTQHTTTSTATMTSSTRKSSSNKTTDSNNSTETVRQRHNNATASAHTDSADYQYIEQTTATSPSQCKNRHNNLNDCSDEIIPNGHSTAAKSYKASNGITAVTTKTVKLNKDNVASAAVASSGKKAKSTNTSAATAAANSFMNNKDEVIVRSVLPSFVTCGG